MPFFVRFDMWKACTTVLSSSLLSVGVGHCKLVFLYYFLRALAGSITNWRALSNGNIHSCGGEESEVRVLVGPCSGQTLQGSLLPCLF